MRSISSGGIDEHVRKILRDCQTKGYRNADVAYLIACLDKVSQHQIREQAFETPSLSETHVAESGSQLTTTVTMQYIGEEAKTRVLHTKEEV